MRKNEHMFENVQNLSQLQKFTAGSGYNWSGNQVFDAAHIRFESSYEIRSLYAMLAANRFDFFPRGVQELDIELADRKAHTNLDLVADTHIALYYTNPFYFFVRPSSPELAETLRQAFETAIDDGSFDKLFYQYYGDAIVNARLNQRKIIYLHNPKLSVETPLSRKKLWLSLDDLAQIKKNKVRETRKK